MACVLRAQYVQQYFDAANLNGYVGTFA